MTDYHSTNQKYRNCENVEFISHLAISLLINDFHWSSTCRLLNRLSLFNFEGLRFIDILIS